MGLTTHQTALERARRALIPAFQITHRLALGFWELTLLHTLGLLLGAVYLAVLTIGTPELLATYLATDRFSTVNIT